MSDFINIRVTEAELDLITLLLEQAGTLEDSTGQPAFELLHDLMEQAARPGEWTEDFEPTDLEGQTFSIAEDDFIDAGIVAREQMKTQRYGEFEVHNTASEIHRPFADSDSRTARLFKGTATSFISNDPIDW